MPRLRSFAGTFIFALCLAFPCSAQFAQFTVAPPGDGNLDGHVDAADFVVWRNNFGAPGTTADYNFNGVDDDGDYLVWRSNFGKTIYGASAMMPETTSIVPEPSTLALSAIFAIFGFSFLGRRRN